MSPERGIFHPSTAPTITLAVDGACVKTLNGPAAGYGIFLDHPPYDAAISEPLPAPLSQESQTAEVKALLSALELVHALRLRHVLLTSDFQSAVNGYNDWMFGWRNRGWRRKGGFKVANRQLWEGIIEYPANFRFRGMNVDVVWKPRNSTPELVEADRLARRACSLNHYCNTCCSYIGRVGTSHNCMPVCNIGNCSSRRFADIDAYNSHYADVHAANRPCRRDDCDLVFGSEKAALSHERMAHNWYVFDCEYCCAVFQDDDERDNHEREDCQFSPYCLICDRWFGSLRAMRQHDDAVH